MSGILGPYLPLPGNRSPFGADLHLTISPLPRAGQARCDTLIHRGGASSGLRSAKKQIEGRYRPVPPYKPNSTGSGPLILGNQYMV